MDKHDEIISINIRMLIARDQVLFILLSTDGSINRMGTGSERNTEWDMFIGKTDPDLFLGLRNQITPELLNWCGQQRADPNLKGKVCELTVVFRRADGGDLGMYWRHGTESLGPPPAVCQFVTAAVMATNPWFENQKKMVRVDDA